MAGSDPPPLWPGLTPTDASAFALDGKSGAFPPGWGMFPGVPPATGAYPDPVQSAQHLHSAQQLIQHPHLGPALHQAFMQQLITSMNPASMNMFNQSLLSQGYQDDKRGQKGGRRRGDDKRRPRDQDLPQATTVELQRLRRGDALMMSDITMEVCMDPQGHKYAVSLLDSASKEEKAKLAEVLAHDVLKAANHPCGCHVVQRLLAVLSIEQQVALVQPLQTKLQRLIESPNGNHVVQKVVEVLPPAHVQWVVDELMPILDMMTVHAYGCRVVQRVLMYCTADQKDPLLDRIMAGLDSLCKEQYGNYVVQGVLEHGRPQDIARICEHVRTYRLDLSFHKYGSNVVERSLLLVGEEEKARIIDHLLGSPQRDQATMQRMVSDRFANYVVQRILEIGSHQQQEEVYWMCKDMIPNLKKTSYGKHIKAKLEKLGDSFGRHYAEPAPRLPIY